MKKSDPVQNWIDNVAYSHSKSESTRSKYTYHLGIFCDFIGKTPEQILEEYDRMTDREFRRKYARYLRALISHLSQQEYAVGTVTFIVASIKSFFKYNDLPLSHVAMARGNVTYHNREITKEEIVKILEISRPRDRAFLCMMTQTGLRPNTLSNLRLKHIQPDFEKGTIPCKVDVPEEIAKGQYHSYWTWMGAESVKYLKAYLATRPGIGLGDYLFTSHGTEKKLDRRSMSHIFRRAIIKLKQKGLMDFEQKQKGKPRTVRLYILRKYFRKYAAPAGDSFVKFWMGHTLGADEHYFSRDVELHRKRYAEFAMPNLRLESSTPLESDKQVQELREELESRNRIIEELQNGMKKIQPLIDFAKTFEDAEDLRNFLHAVTQAPKLITISGPEKTYFQMDVDEDMRKRLKELAKAHGITDPKQEKLFVEEYVRDSILERIGEHTDKKRLEAHKKLLKKKDSRD